MACRCCLLLLLLLLLSFAPCNEAQYITHNLLQPTTKGAQPVLGVVKTSIGPYLFALQQSGSDSYIGRWVINGVDTVICTQELALGYTCTAIALNSDGRHVTLACGTSQVVYQMYPSLEEVSVVTTSAVMESVVDSGSTTTSRVFLTGTNKRLMSIVTEIGNVFQEGVAGNDPTDGFTYVFMTQDVSKVYTFALLCSETRKTVAYLAGDNSRVWTQVGEFGFACTSGAVGTDQIFFTSGMTLTVTSLPTYENSVLSFGKVVSVSIVKSLRSLVYDAPRQRVYGLRGVSIEIYDVSAPYTAVYLDTFSPDSQSALAGILIVEDHAYVACSQGLMVETLNSVAPAVTPTNAPETKPPQTDAPATTVPQTDAPPTVSPTVVVKGRTTTPTQAVSPPPDTTAPETEPPTTAQPDTLAPPDVMPTGMPPLPEATDVPASDVPGTDTPNAPNTTPTAAPLLIIPLLTDVPESAVPDTVVPLTVVPELNETEAEVEVAHTAAPGSVLPPGVESSAHSAVGTASAASPVGGRLAAILALKCEVEDIDLTKSKPLDWEFSPTRVPFGAHAHRYFMGAIVFNILIIVGFFFANYVIAIKLKSYFNLTLENALLYTRFPGLTYIAALWLMTGTTLAAANLAFTPSDAPLPVAVFGAVSLALCVATPFALWYSILRRSRFHALCVQDPFLSRSAAEQLGMSGQLLYGVKRRLYIFAYGTLVWVRTDDEPTGVFVEQYGVLFEQYRPGMHCFALVEMASIIVVALISVLKPHTTTTCTLRNLAVVATLAVYFLLLLCWRPYNARLDHLTTLIASGSTLLAVVFMTVVLMMKGSPEGLSSVLMNMAGVLLVVSAVAVFFKGIYDIVLYVLDIFIERRKTAFHCARQRGLEVWEAELATSASDRDDDTVLTTPYYRASPSRDTMGSSGVAVTPKRVREVEEMRALFRTPSGANSNSGNTNFNNISNDSPAGAEMVAVVEEEREEEEEDESSDDDDDDTTAERSATLVRSVVRSVVLTPLDSCFSTFGSGVDAVSATGGSGVLSALLSPTLGVALPPAAAGGGGGIMRAGGAGAALAGVVSPPAPVAQQRHSLTLPPALELRSPSLLAALVDDSPKHNASLQVRLLPDTVLL